MAHRRQFLDHPVLVAPPAIPNAVMNLAKRSKLRWSIARWCWWRAEPHHRQVRELRDLPWDLRVRQRRRGVDLGKARCRIIGGVTVRIICGLLFLPMPRYSSIPTARLPLIFVRELELLLSGSCDLCKVLLLLWKPFKNGLKKTVLQHEAFCALKGNDAETPMADPIQSQFSTVCSSCQRVYFAQVCTRAHACTAGADEVHAITFVTLFDNELILVEHLLFKELSESFHELGIPVCEEGILELPGSLIVDTRCIYLGVGAAMLHGGPRAA
mmetsp:Transcript_93592/g.222501  ORF Transcript_93592/g.222501 Transcript_93592/m.222501 type:complete len:270 (-) Transcript_93592:7-816(-)